ncbi:ABC transporter substrate-binding protein [Sphingomonas sp. CFBP 13706]|uniref:ABC transporter substrate-binding protein n=1 Tax=Sphingomonas sp. CFBP 13706 TaxID=2775314 RepID=UPI001780EA49|nr:ABC transporter substrate-binding protein [Sphingomonas sp. CFBP 13706]MBD8737232.1 ABC transporter substrate-binding protein [Sphingomonas sp. CFBP 13706]
MTALSIGCTFSDRIEALLDGRVRIAGHETNLHVVEPQRLFRTVLRDAAYDVAELSLASHIAAVAAGRRDYVGVPVFLSRSFRHANLYIRTDRGIDRPEDLAGRTIGLVDWQQTAGLWLRGLLADEHGVSRESIRWIAAGLHAPVLDDRAAMSLPAGIRLERSPATLDTLLGDGAIDAVISPGAPRSFLRQTAPVARLWADPRAAETAYWRRTGLFPIMHILVVRRALVEEEPGLGEALFAAFEEARNLAAADLVSRDFPKLTLPWLNDHAAASRDALNGDPWTYGMEANRSVLETMLRYAQADGLTNQLLLPSELFS